MNDRNPNKRRIAFVIGSMARGGAERVISLLADYYFAKGWDVDVVMLLGKTVHYNLNPGIRLLPICADDSIARIKRAPGWLAGFRKYVKTEKPDIIVSFAARINVIVLLATLGFKKRIIVSERNDPQNDTRGKLGDILAKLLYRRPSDIIFQTQRAKRYFSDRIQAKGTIIPNPVFVETYASSPDGQERKIVNIGKLHPQKNQEMLISAFHRVHMNHPEYSLHIFGAGPLKEQLEKQIRVLGLEGAVILRGNIPDVHQQIADAEIFVLSSDYEGMSNALLEAMMMGLPCISTDCAGSDEVIKNGENGLLVPVGDAAKMADAINRLVTDKSFARELGANARESGELYHKDRVLALWDKVIDK